MFSILIQKTDVPNLENGVKVRVNGHPTTLTREGKYLCYDDENGERNRCKVLVMIPEERGGVYYQCASHGMEGERHFFIDAEGMEVER